MTRLKIIAWKSIFQSCSLFQLNNYNHFSIFHQFDQMKWKMLFIFPVFFFLLFFLSFSYFCDKYEFAIFALKYCVRFWDFMSASLYYFIRIDSQNMASLSRLVLSAQYSMIWNYTHNVMHFNKLSNKLASIRMKCSNFISMENKTKK